MRAPVPTLFSARHACYLWPCSRSRSRAPRLLSLALLTFTFTLATPASAQWPTTEWVVMDGPAEDGGDLDLPVGERGEIADKHRRTLEAASIWYQSFGFPAPNQQATQASWFQKLNALTRNQLKKESEPGVRPGEAYLALLKRSSGGVGSQHDSDGEMRLNANPDFLSADTPLWKLMKASAVHELYHGIQDTMSPSLNPAIQAAPKIPACPGARDEPDTNLSWLVEGTAAMIQVRWLEQKNGVSWGHPFKGSPRAAWVRHFDQSLHRGSLPNMTPVDAAEPVELDESVRLKSWFCSYGTWYFWYAVGDMIAQTDAQKVNYTRYLFNGGEPWNDGGIANVDSGLKAAAAKYNAIGPYRRGLYDLYPQFVAQYLTEDRFYGHLEEVELGAPGLYKTTSSLSGGPLGPLASRAWRVRVRLPQNVSSVPHNVRFTLDAPDGTDLRNLHLIVDDTVYKQHADPTIPYAAVKRTHSATPTAGGAEYLVRVANVAKDAKDASKTTQTEFTLRIEVDGYYGNDVTGGLSTGDIGAIAGELPPGFAVRGPKQWSCSGDAASRAIFDLVTPDEKGRELDRAMPNFTHSMEGIADKLDIITQKAERKDVLDSGTAQQLRAQVAKERARLKANGAAPSPGMDAAAAKARARQTTKILATFVGQNDGEMCQMLLSATLTGREGGAQSVAGAVDKDRYPKDEAPIFNVDVLLKTFFDEARRGFRSAPDKKRERWKSCTMTAEEQQKVRKRAARIGCEPVVCTAGQLNLEEAKQGRISGTFEFDVIRERTSGRCDIPLGRDKVVGHFNVNSTDDGYDDDSLFGGIAIGGVPAGLAGGAGAAATMPGAPIFETDDAVDNALDNLDLGDF